MDANLAPPGMPRRNGGWRWRAAGAADWFVRKTHNNLIIKLKKGHHTMPYKTTRQL
jgi:hypothetical protein